MKPIISFDVDMTLLDHKDWTIPDSALKTVEQLREGHTIVLATGRDMDSSFSVGIREQIRPDAIIHLNGTKITVGGTIIYERLFDKELLGRILAYAEGASYSVGASMDDGDYYTNPEAVRRFDMDRWGECGRRFKDCKKLPSLNVRTMAYIGGENGAKDMERTFPEVYVHMFAGKRGADVVEKTASKAMGLLRLCEYYKMPVSSTVAFGDSMNDYDIVKAAGLGIAMGNAMEELKAAADYVTDAVNKDGIRNACLHFGLI